MIASYYLWLKALHIAAFTSWMAGMLYLPRLYVYHTQVQPGSEASELLKVMERRLLRIIINPAMIATLALGILLMVHTQAWDASVAGGWFHAKAALLVVLFCIHGLLARSRKAFAADQNTKSARYFKVLNEGAAAIMIAIVLLAVIKPF